MVIDMTIDEAIVSLRKSASKSLDYEWQREQYQLAEWLEELKEARHCMEENRKAGYNHGFVDGYNKAIDDFAEKAIKIVYEANNRDRNPQPRDMVADIHYKLLEIAEQLKAGGENEY